MIRAASTGFRCGCGACNSGPAIVASGYAAGPAQPPGMGGIFELVLNAAGATVGAPQLGSQIASFEGPAFAKIKETPDQIAARVASNVSITLQAGTLPSAAGISQQSQQVAAAILPQLAAQLAAQGVYLPAGTVGGELQRPSYFNAFGGENGQWVLIGGAALAGLLILKQLR